MIADRGTFRSWNGALLVIVVSAMVLLFAATAHAAVAGFIPYSGRLTDGAFAGASTTANVRVLLYTCACAPDATLDGTTCTEATRCTAANASPWFDGFHPGVPVVDGYFSLMVGMYDASGVAKPDPANSALTAKLPLPDQLWVTVSVNGAAELAPRQVVGSVPYSVKAENANVAEKAGADIERLIQLNTAKAFCAAWRPALTGIGRVRSIEAGRNGSYTCGQLGMQCHHVVYCNVDDSGFVMTQGCTDAINAPANLKTFACCDNVP